MKTLALDGPVRQKPMNTEAVEKIVMENHRFTIREVAEDVGISVGSCHAMPQWKHIESPRPTKASLVLITAATKFSVPLMNHAMRWSRLLIISCELFFSFFD